MRRLAPVLAALTLLVLAARSAGAQDAFYRVPLSDLKLDGPLPQDQAKFDYRIWEMVRPYAVIDGGGECYIVPKDAQPGGWGWPTNRTAVLIARAPAGREPAGTVYLPSGELKRLVPLRFNVPKPAPDPDAKELFYTGKQWHYEHLLNQNIPGAAWFRYQVRSAQLAINPLAAQAQGRDPSPSNRPGDLQDTYALFTGGRALSESLQLERVMPPRDPTREAVEVELASLRGISTKAMDWKAKLAGVDVASLPRDPLARFIPEDQHAIFFPTFDALVALADEADKYGTLALYAAEPRSEDAGTRARYERQLCLSMTGIGRLLGPQVINGVAVTGSDPYLRVGSDVAVLFEARGDPAGLERLLHAQLAVARQANSKAKPVEGDVAGVPFAGAVSPDRSVCSYVARLDRAVVVTNSKAQLERLAQTQQRKTKSIDQLEEYTFFRSRYRRSEDDEAALVVLSDAAIRRWCGPRWRIADSRRTRAAALLAELQAEHLDALARRDVQAQRAAHTDLYVPETGDLRLTPTGVTSANYGSLEFMTPILELPIDKVTGAEAQAYNAWRRGYENNWSNFFDPIAIRISRSPRGALAADMTIMPLIQFSTYRPLVSVTRGAAIAPGAGDPHDQALVHVVVATNSKSPTVTLWASFVANLLPGDKADLLGAMGQSVAVYVDDDPFWHELARSKEWQQFLSDNLGRLPLAMHVEVKDAERMTQFLSGGRQWAEENYPGRTRWEALEHKGHRYTRVSATDKTVQDYPMLKGVGLYFSNTGGALVVTTHEGMLKRAFDRLDAAKALPPAASPWLGQSAALRLQPKAWDVLRQGLSEPYQELMRRRAWDNLPILNEWKRLYPDQDPVELHRRLWNVKLVDPAEGKYVWNEQFHTMQSTTYGHPGEPRDGPDVLPDLAAFGEARFGLTFEEDGLRARAAVNRAQNVKENAK